MLKNVTKIFVVGILMAIIQPAFPVKVYTVKSNDYLYKIAKNHPVKGIKTLELVDAIKAINKPEIPGIVNNIIKINDQIAIPTTKDEVKSILALDKNQVTQDSYPRLGNSKSTNLKTSQQDYEIKQKPLVFDNSKQDNFSTPSIVVSQDGVPVLIPSENNSIQTVKDSNLDNPKQVKLDSQSHTFSFFKLLFYLALLVTAFFVVKRFWKTQNSKKEHQRELLSKKKRDHLMSRISPVVSDNDFYKPKQSPQEEFDFFDKKISRSQKAAQQSEEPLDKANKSVNLTENDAKEDVYDQQDENTVIKTEKGVILKTNTNQIVKKNTDDNQVEQINSQELIEQDLQYLEELVEQYLENEKYIEASITIQDYLAKDPNNIDLRYKLLEIHARAGDEIAFEGEIHLIKSKNIIGMFDPLHQKIAKLRYEYFG